MATLEQSYLLDQDSRRGHHGSQDAPRDALQYGEDRACDSSNAGFGTYPHYDYSTRRDSDTHEYSGGDRAQRHSATGERGRWKWAHTIYVRGARPKASGERVHDRGMGADNR